MSEQSTFPKSTIVLLTTAALVVVMAGVKSAEPIVTPFLIALFIAAIGAPPMLWMTHRRVPQLLALAVVMFVIIGMALVMSGLVGSSLDGFSRNLPEYQVRLQSISGQILQWLASHGIETDMARARSLLDLSAAMGFVGTAFNRLIGTLANAFLIFLTTAFILLELSSFGHKIREISHNPDNAMSNFGRFSATLNRYLVIKSLMSLATGLTVTLVLSLIGVDYPVLWGIVAFMLNFVPNIGSVIAAIPAVLMALVQFGFAMAGWVALLYVIINSIYGNVIETRLMGRSLGLSALVVFISLVFWGWLLGPVGMFLSVPLTMTLKIGFEASSETRWLAVLLGAEDDLEPEPHPPDAGPANPIIMPLPMAEPGRENSDQG